MNKTSMKIWDINLSKKMIGSVPKKYKIMGMKAYYKKYHRFCGRILLDEKSQEILDGYVIYYVAKIMKINDVPVTIVNKRDRLKYFFKRIFRKVGK